MSRSALFHSSSLFICTSDPQQTTLQNNKEYAALAYHLAAPTRAFVVTGDPEDKISINTVRGVAETTHFQAKYTSTKFIPAAIIASDYAVIPDIDGKFILGMRVATTPKQPIIQHRPSCALIGGLLFDAIQDKTEKQQHRRPPTANKRKRKTPTAAAASSSSAPPPASPAASSAARRTNKKNKPSH